jgi:lactoylglutathione lyase
MPQSIDTATRKPRLVGMNHVALEVGDIEEALAFYGRIFTFNLRGKGKGTAFIDMGDQFIKAPHVLRGMGLALEKTEKARRELAEKGMDADPS